eukprot:CCRYP_016908-RA/>CCRYP_016908-RA protein AED:0.47 eAED:0.47 QI:0/0/0/1/0/0/3/0/132
MKYVLFWMGARATEVAGQQSRFTLPIYPILVEPHLKLVAPLQENQFHHTAVLNYGTIRRHSTCDIRRSTFFPKLKVNLELIKEWPVTVAMNLKGGMDEREFRSYFLNSIVPLFPDAEDVPGKRVIMKVDRGP